MSRKDFEYKIAYNKIARQKMRLENILITALICIIAFTVSFFGAGCDGSDKHSSTTNESGSICKMITESNGGVNK